MLARCLYFLWKVLNYVIAYSYFALLCFFYPTAMFCQDRVMFFERIFYVCLLANSCIIIYYLSSKRQAGWFFFIYSYDIVRFLSKIHVFLVKKYSNGIEMKVINNSVLNSVMKVINK